MGKKKRKKPSGIPNVGIGPHQQVSPMGHATRTKSKHEKSIQSDRKQKQNGWDDKPDMIEWHDHHSFRDSD